jgi:NTE family protein
MESMTKHPEIRQITEHLNKKATKGDYLISDIILRRDGREYQFADLVMEGGGTLGIALVGYIHALEQANVRFLGLGGSSVGAIVSLLAYSCGARTEAKGEKLAGIIGAMDLGSMIDGSFVARRLSRLMGQRKAGFQIPRLIVGLILSLRQLFTKLGLNPGDELYQWITHRLQEDGIATLADFNKLANTLPEGLIHRETGAPVVDYDTSLKIVAADITTSTKAIFPLMTPMYWAEPEKVNPAAFARASASIPGFFQPFTVQGIAGLLKSSENWDKLGSFTGKLPDQVSFADGGILSNFPIDLFNQPGVPRAPTLGARLGSKGRVVKDATDVKQYALNLFNAMRHYADYDFIAKNPLYKYLITHIPTEKYHWLDFNMSEEDKQGLFREGVLAGYKFLEGFNWKQHKALRAAEMTLHQAHNQTIK